MLLDRVALIHKEYMLCLVSLKVQTHSAVHMYVVRIQ